MLVQGYLMQHFKTYIAIFITETNDIFITGYNEMFVKAHNGTLIFKILKHTMKCSLKTGFIKCAFRILFVSLYCLRL